MGKKSRHFHILKMIETSEVSSQQEFLDALNNSEIEISQSTLSKDLKELGIIKVRGKNGQFRFVQTKEREAYHVGVMLKRELVDFLKDTIVVNNFLVIKTVSGNASGLAKCLDEIGWDEIIGTVAGDDTIMVLTESEAKANVIENRLEEMIEA